MNKTASTVTVYWSVDLQIYYSPVFIIQFQALAPIKSMEQHSQQQLQAKSPPSLRPLSETPLSNPQPSDPDFHCQPVTHTNPPGSHPDPPGSGNHNSPSRGTPDAAKLAKMKGNRKGPHEESVKLSRIIRDKRELSQQLTRLQYQQSQLKERERKSVDHLTRSHITREEIHKIHQVLEASKDFEEAVSQKVPKLEQKIKQTIEKEKEEEEKLLTQEKAVHKEEALHQLQLLKKRREDRQKELKDHNKTYQIVRHKKYAHQEIEQQWETQKKKEKEREQQIKASIHRQKRLSVSDIAVHQKTYQSRRQQTSQEKRKKLILERIEKGKVEKETLTRFRPSAFLRTIFQEEENRKRQMDNKSRQYRTYSLKKTEYSENIKNTNRNHWRKGHLKPITEQNPIPEQSNVKKVSGSLSQVELLKLGNSYMREIHSSIGHLELSKVESPKQSPIEKGKHGDYLTKMRLEREQQQKKSRVNNPEMREIRQFKSVMKKSVPIEDKLYFVKLLTSKLEERAGNDTKMMVASINAKLEMINQLIG